MMQNIEFEGIMIIVVGIGILATALAYVVGETSWANSIIDKCKKIRGDEDD